MCLLFGTQRHEASTCQTRAGPHVRACRLTGHIPKPPASKSAAPIVPWGACRPVPAPHQQFPILPEGCPWAAAGGICQREGGRLRLLYVCTEASPPHSQLTGLCDGYRRLMRACCTERPSSSAMPTVSLCDCGEGGVPPRPAGRCTQSCLAYVRLCVAVSPYSAERRLVLDRSHISHLRPCPGLLDAPCALRYYT